MRDKDVRVLKALGSKCAIAIFLLILLYSCNKSKNKIEGVWTVLGTSEAEKATFNLNMAENRRLQFLDGEMKIFNDTNRVGLGLYYYRVQKDSLYLTNIEVDTMGNVDTLSIQTGLVSFKNDTMIIKQENKTYYYKRAKN